MTDRRVFLIAQIIRDCTDADTNDATYASHAILLALRDSGGKRRFAGPSGLPSAAIAQ